MTITERFATILLNCYILLDGKLFVCYSANASEVAINC